MISVTDLRAGTTFEESGQLFQVISYEHIKMGRGSANIKVRVKNLTNGSTIEKSFINGARVNEVYVMKKDMQFLYKDDENVYFMDGNTYEQLAIPLKIVDGHEYLKEGENFSVSLLDGKPLSVMLPPKMVFRVAETGPAIKGNSATNVFKDAVLDNGLKTKVPLFVTIGDLIRVDTRTGAYTEEANS